MTSADDPILQVQANDGVTVLTLNRPDQRNAFTIDLYRAVTAALHQAADDATTGAIVLTGAGPAFCAGTDLGELADIAAGRVPGGAGDGFPLMLTAVMEMQVPLIAAVNGPGVGLGFTILSFCDLVYMSETARLRAPFVDMGVPPEAASSYLLPIRMGWQRAAQALLTGEWVTAQQALAAGLATEVLPPGRVLPRAVEVATRISTFLPGAARTIKRLMIEGERDAIVAARAREDSAYAALFGTRPPDRTT